MERMWCGMRERFFFDDTSKMRQMEKTGEDTRLLIISISDKIKRSWKMAERSSRYVLR